MKWMEKVKAFFIKVWANIELIVRIIAIIVASIIMLRLFSGSGDAEFKKKVEDAKEKNKELKKKADEVVAKAESKSSDVEKTTDTIRKNKEDRDKKADDIFGGGK